MIYRVILLSASIIVAVLLLETVMRVYIFGAAGLSYTKMCSVHPLGRSGLIRASEHQDILFELKPGLDTTYKFHPFTTNSRGLRDREYALTKARGTFRIAVIGDSLTMGSGIPIEQAYHSRLEQRLNDEEDGITYELINFGVSGYFLSQYLATIRHRALDYDPDLILIGFYPGNDTVPPPADKFAEPYQVKPAKNGFFKLHSFSLASDIWSHGVLPRLRGYADDTEPTLRMDQRQRAYVDATFGEIAALTASAGIPVVIAFIDNRPHPATLIHKLAARHGFTFIDATRPFEGTSVQDFSIYLTDAHPNGEANRVIADVLHAELRRASLLPFDAGDRNR